VAAAAAAAPRCLAARIAARIRMGGPSASKSGCTVPPAGTAAAAAAAAAAAEEEEEEEVACPLFLASGARPGRRALALAGALVEASDAPGEDAEEEAREGEVCAGTLDRSTGVVRRPSGARKASAVGSRLVSRRLGGRPVRHDPLAAAPRRGRSAAVGEAQVLMRLWGGL
jgi:colicin import membrane protein